MNNVNTTVLSPNASDAANRLAFCLGVVEAAGYTPCFATSYVDDDGTAFAFSVESCPRYLVPVADYEVVLHADGSFHSC